MDTLALLVPAIPVRHYGLSSRDYIAIVAVVLGLVLVIAALTFFAHRAGVGHPR